MTEKVQVTRHNPNAIPDKRVTVKSKDLPATLFPYPTCLRTTPTPLRLSPRQTSQPTSHFVPPKTFSQNKTHQKHNSVPLNRFIWDKTLRPAFFRAKRTWSCYRTDTHKL